MTIKPPLSLSVFLSTLPARGATNVNDMIFSGVTFLSTLPARGATRGHRRRRMAHGNFYPRSPRGERHLQSGGPGCKPVISIHAPREGSDIDLGQGLHLVGTISIHAPREGSDPPKPA